MPTLAAGALEQYDRFTLYDSPYVAHREGRAIDLFPNDRSGPDGRSVAAPSPVAGEVRDVRTVRAPTRAYAESDDHLLVVDVDAGLRPSARELGPDERPDEAERDYLARIMHVDPSVEPGDRVEVGDSLGRLVRSGYFAPWVDNHLHVGVRTTDDDPYRASGSLRLDVEVSVEPIPWNGTARVREVGDAHAWLDAPSHPAPGRGYVGVEGGPGIVLDGGCPHYAGGGAHPYHEGPVRLAGHLVGAAEDRDVEWAPIEVRANGDPIRGLSLVCARDADFGVKLVCPDRSFAVGDDVSVSVHTTEE